MIKKHLLALDVGGTSIMASLYTQDLEEITSKKIASEAQSGKDVVLEKLIALVSEMIDQHTAAVALAWAGFVDSHSGKIITSPNIPGFEGFEITRFLSEKFQVPVYIENDTKLFAYAEQQLLHPYSKTFLGIIMGTGLGCGIVLNGEIFKGANGNAGELGHAMFVPQFAPENEVEKKFTGVGLSARVLELTGIESLESLGKRFEENDEEIYTKLHPIVEELAIWLYGLILTFDPDTIVFGGGVGKNVILYLLPHIKKSIADKFEKSGYPYTTKLEISQVLNSGLVGAGILSRNNS